MEVYRVENNFPLPDDLTTLSLVEQRRRAEQQGLTKFMPSRPCANGHLSERYVVSGICVECQKRQKIKHKGKYKETERKYYERNRDRVRNNALKCNYGITLKEYNELLWKQGGRCAICRNILELGKRTHVDHCHDTGRVRGILCHACNVGIGHFRHSPLLLKLAANYCEKI